MIPSISLRIDLILADGPQAVQPGMFRSNVCCAAAIGWTRTKTNRKPASRRKLFLPVPMDTFAIHPKHRSLPTFY